MVSLDYTRNLNGSTWFFISPNLRIWKQKESDQK